MTIKKGQKRLKNIPILHEEVKTKRTVVLTPSAWQILQNVAKKSNTSVSEVIESLARNLEG